MALPNSPELDHSSTFCVWEGGNGVHMCGEKERERERERERCVCVCVLGVVDDDGVAGNVMVVLQYKL